MAVDVGSAVGYLLLDTSKWTSGLSGARNALHTFQDQTTTASDKFTAMGTALGSVGKTMTLGVTAPLVGMGAAAVKTAADFEMAMDNVQAISGATGDEMDQLNAKAQEMGAKTKFSASEAADAFSYMAMAGWKTNDMLNGIEGVMSLAAASGENLASVSDIVTDAMTAFGLAADETSIVLRDGVETEVANTTRFVDVLAAASNNANTNVSMLGESFKYVAPVAGSMGYSVEDTAIALGLMANSGIKASQAGTSLRTMITNMVNPTDTMASAMTALGVSLEDGEGNLYSFMDVMKQLREGFQGGNIDADAFTERMNNINNLFAQGKIDEDQYSASLMELTTQMYGAEGAQKAQLAAMLAGKTGLSGFLAIVSASDEDFNKLSESIYNASGTAQEMSEIQLDNLNGQITILKSGVEAMAIAFGNLLMPMIEDATEVIQGIVDWINNLDENQKRVIVTIAEVAAAVGPVLLIVGKIATGIGTLIPMLSGAGGISGILTALTGPIGIVIAAVVALTAAWATNFGGIRDKTQEIMDAIGNIISSAWNLITGLWNDNFLGIQNIAADIWKTISDLFEDALNIITDIFDVFSNLFTGNWSGLWESVKTLVSDVWNAILDWIGNILNLIVDTILGIGFNLLRAATTAFEKVGEGFQNVWDTVMSWLQQAINDPIGTIEGIGTALYNAGSKIFSMLFDGLKSVWESITSWVGEKVQWLADKVTFWENESKKVDTPSPSGPSSWNRGSYASGLDYVPRDMNVRVHEGEAIITAEQNKNNNNKSGGGDTYNFYSPEALTPVKAAREFKRVKQELALGYR